MCHVLSAVSVKLVIGLPDAESYTWDMHRVCACVQNKLVFRVRRSEEMGY